MPQKLVCGLFPADSGPEGSNSLDIRRGAAIDIFSESVVIGGL